MEEFAPSSSSSSRDEVKKLSEPETEPFSVVTSLETVAESFINQFYGDKSLKMYHFMNRKNHCLFIKWSSLLEQTALKLRPRWQALDLNL